MSEPSLAKVLFIFGAALVGMVAALCLVAAAAQALFPR